MGRSSSPSTPSSRIIGGRLDGGGADVRAAALPLAICSGKTIAEFERGRHCPARCITVDNCSRSMPHFSKYVCPPYCLTEMYASHVVCCPLVSHVEYAPRGLLSLEKQEAQLSQRDRATRYAILRAMGVIKVSNRKSDLQGHTKALAMVPFERSHTISY